MLRMRWAQDGATKYLIRLHIMLRYSHEQLDRHIAASCLICSAPAAHMQREAADSTMTKPTTIDCIAGRSAGRDVLMGFAPASLLCALSFADVLDEDTGHGYQRRFNAQHSLDFRR